MLKLARLSIIAVMGMFLALALPAAQAEETFTFDLPEQPLADALRAVGQQTSTNVMFEPRLVKDLKAPAVKTRGTVGEAIRLLLSGTQLNAVQTASNSILISAANTSNKTSAEIAQIADLQLARAEEEKGQSPKGSDSSNNEERGSSLQRVDDPSKASKGDDSRSESESSKGIPEMLVKGAKVTNVDIKRTEDDVQPYVVFSRDEITQSHANNVEDFLKARLPMNAVQQTNNQNGVGTFGNQSSVDLRGLGTNQTLILVDGRRVPNVSAFDDRNSFIQPDINGIPLASVERIEVLPSTAGGIYGGGATGGVINIIRRQDYTGLEVGMTYGNTFETDVADRQIHLSSGFSLEGGKTNVLVAASHRETNPLLVGERDFAARGRSLQLANNPDAFNQEFFPPLGFTTNICSATVLFPGFGFCNSTPLVLDDGTPLNSPRTSVPVGYGGPASDGGQALVQNAGQYNLDIPNTLFGAEQSLYNNPTVESVFLDLRRSFSERVETYLSGGWQNNHGKTLFAPGVQQLAILEADAPNNPFTSDIVVLFPPTELSVPFESKSETTSAGGGVIVHLPRGWSSAFDYQWSRSRFSITATSPVIGDPDGAGPAPSAGSALESGVLDVMRDLNAVPLDYSPYIMPSPNFFSGPFDTILKDMTARLTGPLLVMPAGELTVSSIVARRKEEARDAFTTSMDADAVTRFSYFPDRSQDVDSFYLEFLAPLISGGHSRVGARILEVQASVRHDRYKTKVPMPILVDVASKDGPFPELAHVENKANATTHTMGMRYSPIEGFALRASYGTGFLPPSIGQVVPNNPFNVSLFLIDHKRGGTQNLIVAPVTSGGNPELVPEESKSLSLGVVLSPPVLPGLRLSLDYTKIEKTREIASLGFQELLDLEDILSGRVSRAPLTSEDAALGFTGGVITALDFSLVNIAATDVEAYDAQLDYMFETATLGKFHFYTVVTHQPTLERRSAPASPDINSAGFNGGPLEWRGNAGLTWSSGAWTLGGNAQYYDSYFVYTATAPDFVVESTVLNQGSHTIPSQTYVDAFARYRVGESSVMWGGLLANTEITLGVQNLFDKNPPTLATTAPVGGYSFYGDPRLRRYSISIQKQFGR